MAEIHTLTLQETHRAGGGGKTARHYFDFYVSGKRLLNLLGWPDADYITSLGWGPIKNQQQAVAKLLRREKPSLPSGRYELFVCPECADIGCGAVTAHIEREGEIIIWRNFAFENNYENPQTFDKFGSLHFNSTDYWQVLNSFRPDEK